MSGKFGFGLGSALAVFGALFLGLAEAPAHANDLQGDIDRELAAMPKYNLAFTCNAADGDNGVSVLRIVLARMSHETIVINNNGEGHASHLSWTKKIAGGYSITSLDGTVDLIHLAPDARSGSVKFQSGWRPMQCSKAYKVTVFTFEPME
jgi:hypothetical protein